jgi:hypothetical protein
MRSVFDGPCCDAAAEQAYRRVHVLGTLVVAVAVVITMVGALTGDTAVYVIAGIAWAAFISMLGFYACLRHHRQAQDRALNHMREFTPGMTDDFWDEAAAAQAESELYSDDD